MLPMPQRTCSNLVFSFIDNVDESIQWVIGFQCALLLDDLVIVLDECLHYTLALLIYGLFFLWCGAF